MAAAAPPRAFSRLCCSSGPHRLLLERAQNGILTVGTRLRFDIRADVIDRQTTSSSLESVPFPGTRGFPNRCNTVLPLMNGPGYVTLGSNCRDGF